MTLAVIMLTGHALYKKVQPIHTLRVLYTVGTCA
jgi:hypothetical protein